MPIRTAKPRDVGLTHVIDVGLSARQAEDLVDVAGEHIDILKLGWGTACVTGNLAAKIAAYRSSGIAVMCGGTLLEVAIAQGREQQLIERLLQHDITHIEVSDGTIELARADKLALISQLSKHFVVLSEVGSKDADARVDASEWADWAEAELAAGAWKVVTEARESGTVGTFADDGSVNSDMIDVLVTRVGVESLVFEAPLKSQQTWFIKQFGPQVNLGNIPTDQVIALETLRLGLRGDTLLDAASWPRNVLPSSERSREQAPV